MVSSWSAQWWHYSVGESVEIISCVIWPAAIRSQLSALLWSHQSGHPAYHTSPLSPTILSILNRSHNFVTPYSKGSNYFSCGRFGRWKSLRFVYKSTFSTDHTVPPTWRKIFNLSNKFCQLYRQIFVCIDSPSKFITKIKIFITRYSMRCYVLAEEKRMNESPLETRPHQGPA